MGRTVHQPCKIQRECVSNNHLREECPEKAFAPKIHRNRNWQNEAKQQLHWNKPSNDIETKNKSQTK